jgi:hypothetical protein
MSIAWMMGAFGVARADTIKTFSQPMPTSSVPFTYTFPLPGFNTSLGTLDAITLALKTTGTVEVDVENLNFSPESFTNATASIPITLTGPAGVTTTVDLSAGPLSGTAAPFFNAFPGLVASATGSVSVLPADFVDYEGLGLIGSVSIDATPGTYLGNSASNVSFGGSATASAVATVSYAYDPSSSTIPEPATMSLLGGALLGISFFLKRFVTPR